MKSNNSTLTGTTNVNIVNENPTHSAAYNPVNLHKELLAIQAAAASASSKKPSHTTGSGSNSSNKSSLHHSNSLIGNNAHLAGMMQSSLGSQQTPKDKNSSTNSSLNSLNTLSQFSNLGLSSQQNVQAAMNALAASNSAKVKDYMSSGILR